MIKFFRIAIAIFVIVISPVFSHPSTSQTLPPLQTHPLPTQLQQWKEDNNAGNYFTQIETTPMGYLVWSHFPITVYVETPSEANNNAEDIRFMQWYEAVITAIIEWDNYLPLQRIEQPETADIAVMRSHISREIKLNSETGLYDIPRAITAQTIYKFYPDEASNTIRHKMTVNISPELGKTATLGAARHEFGHALGIWGHSKQETDALYFSQVKEIPKISVRDINTLKKIYQQPTRLGWKVS